MIYCYIYALQVVVGYDVKLVGENRFVAQSIWSGARSTSKLTSKAKAKAESRRDKARAHEELSRKTKLIFGDLKHTCFILRQKWESGTYKSE